MELRRIDKTLLPAFRPYLAPDVTAALEDGDEKLIAWGAVTEDGHTCAAAAAFPDEEDGSLVLCSLFVDPQVRRQGVATLLLDRIEEQQPLESALWSASQEDLPALTSFFQGRGLEVDVDDRPIMRLSCASMQKLPVCRRAFLPNFKPEANVIPLSEITKAELEELLADESIPENLRFTAFGPETLEAPTSFAYRYKGVIAAYFLAEPTVDGFVVKSAVSRPMCHGAAFFQLAAAGIHASLPYLTPTSSYWLEAINSDAEILAKYLSSDHYELWYEGMAERRQED